MGNLSVSCNVNGPLVHWPFRGFIFSAVDYLNYLHLAVIINNSMLSLAILLCFILKANFQ